MLITLFLLNSDLFCFSLSAIRYYQRGDFATHFCRNTPVSSPRCHLQYAKKNWVDHKRMEQTLGSKCKDKWAEQRGRRKVGKDSEREVKRRARERGRVNWKYLWRVQCNYSAVLLLIIPSPDRTCMRVVYIINNGDWSILCFLFSHGWVDDRERVMGENYIKWTTKNTNLRALASNALYLHWRLIFQALN